LVLPEKKELVLGFLGVLRLGLDFEVSFY
jgi:hypothetical protein